MKLFLAIDPGLSGGIAMGSFNHTQCEPMPETQGDLIDLIRDFKHAADTERNELVCVLEEVSGYAGQAQPGSAMFKFGEHYGFIKGVVQTLGIKLVLVRPQTWQKGFGLGTASRCASRTEWKNKLKAEAQRRFPQLTVTLQTADALLILEWFSQLPNGAHGVRRPTWGEDKAEGDQSLVTSAATSGGRSATRPTLDEVRGLRAEDRSQSLVTSAATNGGAHGVTRSTTEDGGRSARRPTSTDF